VQRGERVIGDLGSGGGYRADESRFAGIGHAQQTDIGNHLELELEVELLALAAAAALPRRTVGGTLVACIAEPVETAARDQHRLRLRSHVGDQLTLVQRGYHRAQRHFDDDILALVPGLVLALTVGAALCDEPAGMAKIGQRIQILGADHVNRAAVAAVAAVGAAHRNIFLAAETDDAVTAIAGLYENIGFIDKFHRGIIPSENKKASRGRGFRSLA
jgi:hypothetical protein